MRAQIARESGSSPRPWGTRSVSQPRRRRGAVHPHARGEHISMTVWPFTVSGSSPHPWGTRLLRIAGVAPGRFIPTPVGNTIESFIGRHSQTVHPHTRGEHEPVAPGTSVESGSSPHPWGTHAGDRRAVGERRFIPTPVGNTSAGERPSVIEAVHPHTRGEHRSTLRASLPLCGSSPHPWGTRRGRDSRIPQRRFIPTPVGNTAPRRWSRSRPAVHPHTRGEHGGGLGGLALHVGSSPHPWGTRGHGVGNRGDGRFIPTPVGNTLPR